MSFVERLLDFTITLAPKGGVAQTFKGIGANPINLTGFRATTKIIKAGGAVRGQLTASIYGLTLSKMNQLSTLGMKIQLVPRNLITVKAGDSLNGMYIVFQGNIVEAYADMQSAPEVVFRITAAAGNAAAIETAPTTSYPGGVDINVIMAGLAKQMGLAFESNVPPTFINNPYYYGSSWDQMRSAAKAVGISATIDNGTLIIWPRNGARKSSPNGIPEINVQSGMVSYPAYTAQGIRVRTVFNPAIKFGSKVKITSDLTPANGTWSVLALDHALDTQMPNGLWFSELSCYNPSFPVVPK